MSYLNNKGDYYKGDPKEYGGAIPCMKRPEGEYKLIPDPLSDPMNCWIPKTAQDLDDEIDSETDEQVNNNAIYKALALLACEKAGEDITDAAVRTAAFQRVKQLRRQIIKQGI